MLQRMRELAVQAANSTNTTGAGGDIDKLNDEYAQLGQEIQRSLQSVQFNGTTLLSGVMMLRYLGQFDKADLIEQATLATLEDGVYTQDVKKDAGAIGTQAFAEQIIKRFGRTSTFWHARDYRPIHMTELPANRDYVRTQTRKSIGMDVFVESPLSAEELGKDLRDLAAGTPFSLQDISSRGVIVYPHKGANPDTVDHWRMRFMMNDGNEMSDEVSFELLRRIGQRHRWMHIEKLNEFDGENGYTKAQGED
jgi:isocitrate dehydrogenase